MEEEVAEMVSIVWLLIFNRCLNRLNPMDCHGMDSQFCYIDVHGLIVNMI